MDKISLGLVDDHALFRSGIKALFSDNEKFEVIVEANNGQEFIQKINKKFSPKIVLIDLNMPIMNGYDLSVYLKSNFPNIKVIILSMELDEDDVFQLIKIGIDGYILKDSDKNEFLVCLDSVSSGEIYFTPKVNKVIQKKIITINRVEQNVSLKEREFLTLLCKELTYKEIAEIMNVSVRTIDGYRDQLFYKLNVNNKTGLILYAIKNKIFEL